MTSQDTASAQAQARAQLDSVIAMVRRLEHANECRDADCGEVTADEMAEALGIYVTRITEADSDTYHDEDNARQAIVEDALSVEVRSRWQLPGEDLEPAEYNILLCTGGPAVRITGDLDAHGGPTSATLEYQDWFTSWQEYITRQNETAALMTYAGEFLGF